MRAGARSHCTAALPHSDRAPVLQGLALVQGLALLSMLVDHLGAVGLLQEWSRIVGRVALPAFVVMVAANVAVAADPAALVRRLCLLLVVSQPVWWLSVGSWGRLCILVTLLAVVLLVWVWRLRRWDRLALVLVGFLLVSPWVEYGPWPLLLVPLGVVGRRGLPVALVWPLVVYPLGSWFQVVALGAVLGIALALRFPFNVPRAPRWLTRWFYPGHLLILAVTKNAIW